MKFNMLGFPCVRAGRAGALPLKSPLCVRKGLERELLCPSRPRKPADGVEVGSDSVLSIGVSAPRCFLLT
jgi:hypothetical protein